MIVSSSRAAASHAVACVAVITAWTLLCLSGISGIEAKAEEPVDTESLPDVATDQTPGYLQGELIYPLEGRPTPQCHASTIVETPQGLVAAWFGGSHEKNPDVGIWVARHDGQSWSRPVRVATGAEGESTDYACWNPVLFQPSKGPLMLFYKVGIDPRNWSGMRMTSDDGGQTWSAPRKLGQSDRLPPANRNLIGPVKNKPVELADGTLLCPSSTENDGWRVHFERTSDGGESWEVIGPINDASRFDAIQPSILRHADGRMQILCRTQQGVIAQSWSDDGGRTWGEMTATSLPNPNAGTDAVTLADGRQLLVYNHARRTRQRSGREILNVALSDDGRSWRPVMTLERDDQRAEYSYPAVIQTRDGKVHITYTWQRRSIKHVILDPDQLK